MVWPYNGKNKITSVCKGKSIFPTKSSPIVFKLMDISVIKVSEGDSGRADVYVKTVCVATEIKSRQG